MKKTRGHIDWFILIPVIGLLLFSIVAVYSSSAPRSAERFGDVDVLFIKHTINVIIALFVMILVAKLDYHIYIKLDKPIIIISVITLILVLIFGIEYVNSPGVKRWLDIGIITIQPVEFVKFAVVIYFASLLVKKQNVIKTLHDGFLPFMFWLVLICTLIAFQPNYSNMFLIFLIGMIMLFVGNVNLLYILGTGLVGVVSAGMFAWFKSEYFQNRISAFISGNETITNTARDQLQQGLIALGSGGFFGLGPGQTRQSHLHLPESYGDFIFSVVGEEYGFFGLLIIMSAFGLIFIRGMLIAKKAPDLFGYFLSIGIVIVFALYLFTNAAVNTGIFPTTGVPLPFISYGGTAVVIYAFAIGILLNISTQSNIFPKTHSK